MTLLRATKARGAAFGLALVTAFAIVGCGTHRSDSRQGARNGSGALKLRIGYGKGGSLDIVRLQKTLEKRLAAQGVGIEWLQFPMGPQMMEGIGAGSVDIGATAATPPIFAQAAGIPFVYVANIPQGRSGAGGILVPRDSPIQSVSDLRGKRIAFQPGSIWQYDLVKLLEQAGIEYKDVTPVKLPPADAFAAFNSGSIDAWVQGEPYITLAQRKSGARLIATTAEIPTAGGFYLAAAAAVRDHPELIRDLLEELQRAGDWAFAHPHEAALLTASHVGLDVPTVEHMISQGNNTKLQAIDDRIVAQQQEQADLFEKLGVLPKHIVVREVILPREQYARLIPANAGAGLDTKEKRQ